MREILFILRVTGRRRRREADQLIIIICSWLHKTVRYSIGKYLKNTVHWDSVGLGCVAMPPCYWCHVWVHTQLMYTHIHTYAHLLSVPSTRAMSTYHKTNQVPQTCMLSRMLLTVRSKEMKTFWFRTTPSSVFILANLSWAVRPLPVCHSCVDNRSVEHNSCRFHLLWQSLVWFSDWEIKLLWRNNVSRSGMKTFIHSIAISEDIKRKIYRFPFDPRRLWIRIIKHSDHTGSLLLKTNSNLSSIFPFFAPW